MPLTTPQSVGTFAAMPTKAPKDTMTCPRCNGSGRVPEPYGQGAAMRKAREDSGMSLRAMATTLGISAAYLSDLELGRRTFPRGLLEQFEKTLTLSRAKPKPTKRARPIE